MEVSFAACIVPFHPDFFLFASFAPSHTECLLQGQEPEQAGLPREKSSVWGPGRKPPGVVGELSGMRKWEEDSIYFIVVITLLRWVLCLATLPVGLRLELLREEASVFSLTVGEIQLELVGKDLVLLMGHLGREGYTVNFNR